MMLRWLLLLLLVSLLLLLLLLLLSGRQVFALRSESHRCDGLSAVLSAAPGAPPGPDLGPNADRQTMHGPSNMPTSVLGAASHGPCGA